MKNSLKGSLAALAAAGLLLGGTGTLAYWNAETDVPGATIDSGELKLGNPVCTNGWRLDGGAAYTTQLLVPGDVLTKSCTIDLVATGAHLSANLGLSTPVISGDPALAAELTPTADFTVGGATKSIVTSTDDTGTGEIGVTLSVTFETAADNATQDLTAALEDITVTATQRPH